MTAPNYFVKFGINSWGKISFPHPFADLFNNKVKKLRINAFTARMLFKCFSMLDIAVNAVNLRRAVKFQLREFKCVQLLFG